jgi:hypothetical protein
MDPWELADWRHAGLAASTLFPFGGPKPSPEDMAAELGEILADCPDYYPALLNLGTLEAGAGRTEEARKHLLDAADRMAERERHLEADLSDLVDEITHRLGSISSATISPGTSWSGWPGTTPRSLSSGRTWERPWSSWETSTKLSGSSRRP